MGHKCKGLILHCIDFRLGVTIKDYLDKQNLIGDIDIVSIAGGVKDLDYAMKQIEISERLHGISEIILMNHTDCGAYGGRAAFGSDEEEMEKHKVKLMAAKKKINECYPNITVKCVIAKILGHGVEFENL